MLPPHSTLRTSRSGSARYLPAVFKVCGLPVKSILASMFRTQPMTNPPPPGADTARAWRTCKPALIAATPDNGAQRSEYATLQRRPLASERTYFARLRMSAIWVGAHLPPRAAIARFPSIYIFRSLDQNSPKNVYQPDLATRRRVADLSGRGELAEGLRQNFGMIAVL